MVVERHVRCRITYIAVVLWKAYHTVLLSCFLLLTTCSGDIGLLNANTKDSKKDLHRLKENKAKNSLLILAKLHTCMCGILPSIT